MGAEKYFVKGVTYGSFPPHDEGHQFPPRSEVARDLLLMRSAGINTVLTYTVPPVWLLDEAEAHGIRVIVNVPWMDHVCFLGDRATRRRIRMQVRDGVQSCRRHPAVLMFCVGKEIPPAIVRWHGPARIQEHLEDLYKVAKDADPTALVTYTNFPTTEYLELPFVDVYTFNVYLHQRSEFCRYLSRLQHIAGELPLVITELGMCSFRHGAEGQAAFLDWQIEETFDHGAAGVVVFGWTDPFYQDGCLIDEWGFGLVDALRAPKPSFDTVARRFTSGVPFPPQRRWPKVSVVVATYNEGRTLDSCLRSLLNLHYPDYEVIVVNDGCTDGSEKIIERYPFRTITQPNRGVSAARNEGWRAASGEIIAYIDSDARADPDWLSFLVATFLESDYAAVGGPNVLPGEDNWVAKCVYRSPGGPTHVMLDDQSAEHIPGVNMAFWKWALEQIDGFDPVFRKAADDVDVCWRLLADGLRIGFNPAAVVWHHRRPSVRTYWRQQVGYGESEALLERKHPYKFNPWGHAFWAGRIYAPYPFFRLFARPVIYHGLWGSAGFQRIYQYGGEGLLTYLPRAMEWHLGLAVLTVVGLAVPWVLLFVMAGVGYTAYYSIAASSGARLRHARNPNGRVDRSEVFRSRVMIALLHFLEPIARDWGRIKGGLTPWRSVRAPRTARLRSRLWERAQPFWRTVSWGYRGGPPLDRYAFLERMLDRLAELRGAVGWNAEWQNWDLRVRRGALTQAEVRVVVEHGGGPRRLARVSCVIRPLKAMYWLQIVLAAAVATSIALDQPDLALLCGALLFLVWIALCVTANRLEAAVGFVADEVAAQLDPNCMRV